MDKHKIKLIYYTDPICSTCWTNEPYFRKLILEYSHVLEVEYRMGGLLESWETYRDPYKQIKTPKDLVIPWNNLGKISGMSLDGDLWIDNPVTSSYPASLAFYAAQQQDASKAKKFIRAVRELLFLYKKDVANLKYLLLAAKHVGLDNKQFLKDFKSIKTQKLFKHDLKEKQHYGVSGFPSFIFINNSGEKIILNTCYDNVLWEETIQKLSSKKVYKTPLKHNIAQVLTASSLLSTTEIAVLLNLDLSSAESQLLSIEQNGYIKHIQFKYAKFWHNVDTKPIISNKKTAPLNISIIGGGLAGLCAAICLKKEGRNVKIIEASSKKMEQGLGFIIMPNGINIFKKLGLDNALLSKGNLINTFVSMNAKGQVIQNEKMNPCVAISRVNCINILLNEIPKSSILFGKKVISYDKHAKGYHLNFADQSKINTNLVISSEGTNSIFRKNLFPETKGVEIKEKEIVGMAHAPALAKKLGNTFYKINNAKNGFNMGILPSGENEVIWFIQLNEEKISIPENSVEALQIFSLEISKNLPAEFVEAISLTNFHQVYLWRLFDAELLPSFHKNGIALIGDAAHPLLSFTSQGASTALEDAYYLSMMINNKTSNEKMSSIYSKFYTLRKKEIGEYIDIGRLLLDQFMHPENYTGYNLPYVDYGSK